MRARRENVRVDDTHEPGFNLPPVCLTPDVVHASWGEHWWRDGVRSVACANITYGDLSPCVTPTTEPVTCVACLAEDR